MDKLNALFKSHRLRLNGLTVKTTKSTEVEDESHKSAPCTPYLDRTVVLAVPGEDKRSSPRLAHLDCAGSTPRLSRALDCTAQAAAVNLRSTLGQDLDVIEDLGGRISPDYCSGLPHSRHHLEGNIPLAANDRSRRPRKHRARERHRASHRIPSGLDRSWEAHRIEGLEMLQHSTEQRRERQCHREHSLPDQVALAVTRDRSKSRSDSNRCHHRTQLAEPAKLPELKVCIERRLIELTHQLAEERQKSRQDRLTIAKLQQELARHKSEHPLREVLMKELERERRLRIEAENRLRTERLDTCDCKSQATELQKELVKAKEFAHSLMPYKGKFERLKEDYTSVTMNFESQLESLQSEIRHLTEDNSSLATDVSRLQKACANCRLCSQNTECRLSVSGASHSDDSVASGADKTRVLLERLKMLEAEKTCLILENEKQCEQYEKCLDDITSQVLQALMTQRNLKEECCKLRGRVVDLQQQNSELRQLFTSQNDSPKKCKANSWEGQQSICELAISFGSLTSMYSDHEQMQFLVSRLASPTAIDFSDIGDGMSSVADAPALSRHPVTGAVSGESQPSDSVIQQQQPHMENTGSTVSLNELLDSCCNVVSDSETQFDCVGNEGDLINNWADCGGGEGLGHNLVEAHVASSSRDELAAGDVTTDANRHCLPSDALLQTSSAISPAKGLGCRYSHADVFNCTANTTVMSLNELYASSSSSSEPTRLLDDGYHSNTTSVMSPEGTACSHVSTFDVPQVAAGI